MVRNGELGIQRKDAQKRQMVPQCQARCLSLIKGIFLILIMSLRERQSDTMVEERNKVVAVVTAETFSSF